MKLKKFLISSYYKVLAFRDRFKYRFRKSVYRFTTWIKGFFVDKTPDYKKLSKCRRLIICAHPDDETLFFFSVMGEGTYVVCMSNCGEKTRRKEFYDALKYQKTEGVMFNCPDMSHSSWMWSKMFVKRKFKKIRKVLNYDCEIFTHSIEGESGHDHHFSTGKVVDKCFEGYEIYHTVDKSEKGKILSEDAIREKNHIISDIYCSQVKMLTRWCWWFEGYMKFDSFLK